MTQGAVNTTREQRLQRGLNGGKTEEIPWRVSAEYSGGGTCNGYGMSCVGSDRLFVWSYY